jgi:hypothetical protein
MRILKKARFVLVLISFSVCLGLMSSTYSRYVAGTTSNIEVLFAKWQILVNNTDITSNTSSSITFVPVIEENNYVEANTVAPSSKGYFDIAVDPSNVGVSFKYTINLAVANENMPDLMITKYSIIPSTYVEGDPLEVTNLTDNTITNTLNFDKNITSFKFTPFTIRVYFEWYEGTGETMTDTEDTAVGLSAVTDNTKFQMTANINFEQIFE